MSGDRSYWVIFICLCISMQSNLIAQCLPSEAVSDLYEFLDASEDNHIDFQITHINSISPQGLHYYTSWCKTKCITIDEGCSLSFDCYQKYSNRNFFRGVTDEISYKIDLNTSDLIINNNALGDDGLVLRDPKKKGNLLYYQKKDGMIILNSNKIKGAKIE